MSGKTQVLHLLGSTSTKFYFDLSMMYGRTCAEFEGLDHVNFEHKFAVVYLSGKWGFPAKLDEASVQAAEKNAASLGEALAKIEFMEPPIDVVMPHMFDFKGMTRYRALFEMLNIEVLGNPPDVCSIAEDKFLTKAVCQLAGVPVPKAELLRQETHGADVVATAKQILERRSAPFIVKPAQEGNSRGVSLVKTDSVEEVTAALSAAFDLHDQILLEEYIAGRECRVAVLEVAKGNDVQLMVLPKIEYILEDIRDSTKKLGTDASGQLLTGDDNVDEAIKKGKTQGERICPAQFDPEIHARLDDLGKRAHKALGCKYYSLYDVRIDKDGYPFMLESCLFCSFSPWSIIVGLAGKMEGSDFQEHPKLFETLLRRAAAETRARRAAAARTDTCDKFSTCCGSEAERSSSSESDTGSCSETEQSEALTDTGCNSETEQSYGVEGDSRLLIHA